MRWMRSETKRIQSFHIANALHTLERAVQKAKNGSAKAKEVLFGSYSEKGSIMKAVQAASLVAGLGWLLKDDFMEGTDKPETHPHQSKPKAQQRTSQRRKTTPRS